MRRLLVVEDDREISGLLQQFLQENNFEVDVANEGNEASEYIQNEKYDIISSSWKRK